MGKKLIALSASDLHFHDWKQFNENGERTQITTDFIMELCTVANEYEVPVLVPGDWFHTPKGLSTKTLSLFNKLMAYIRSNYPDTRFITTSGNHDLDRGVSLVRAMQYAFPDTINCIDNDVTYLNGVAIFGLPYTRRNTGLVDKIDKISKHLGKKILLLHTELYGAPDPSGYEPEPQNLPRNLPALFKDFDLVLAGHIHKHTQVCKNIYMVGAPNQQRKSDAGCDMGYLKIYDDFSVEFVEVETPRFRYFKEGDEHENTNDFWIEVPKPKKMEKHSEASFKPTMDKTKMAKRYMKETGVKSIKKLNTLIGVLNETDD